MRALNNVNLSERTTLGVGGPCPTLYEIEQEEELTTMLLSRNYTTSLHRFAAFTIFSSALIMFGTIHTLIVTFDFMDVF